MTDPIKEALEVLKDDLSETYRIPKEALFAGVDFVSACVNAAREHEKVYVEYYQEVYGVDIKKLCEGLMECE